MIHRPVRRRALLPAALLAAAGAALASPGSALAQPVTPAEEIAPPGVAEAPEGPAYGVAEDAAFIGTLGFLGGVAPDYPGSDDYEFVPAPYLRLEYRDLLFVRGTRAGANLLRLGSRRDGLGLRAGPVVRFDRGRDDDENAAIDELDDVDPGAEAGAFVELGYLFTALKLEARQEVAGGHGGLVVEVEADASLPLTPRLRVDLGVGAAWADDDFMGAYFGIDPEEAPLAGFPAFDPDPGVKSASARLGASYFLTDHWLLRLQTAYGRLLGDAADSPIVADAGSPNQFYAGLGAAYRFAF